MQEGIRRQRRKCLPESGPPSSTQLLPRAISCCRVVGWGFSGDFCSWERENQSGKEGGKGKMTLWRKKADKRCAFYSPQGVPLIPSLDTILTPNLNHFYFSPAHPCSWGKKIFVSHLSILSFPWSFLQPLPLSLGTSTLLHWDFE